jgi:hypothetical protein
MYAKIQYTSMGDELISYTDIEWGGSSRVIAFHKMNDTGVTSLIKLVSVQNIFSIDITYENPYEEPETENE